MTTIETSQASHEAYEAIRDLIVHGKLGPGSRLVERDLARYLRLSRSPIRSALQRLHQEQYVVSLNGERARLVVAPLTQADARDLFSLLGFIDSSAARAAAMLNTDVRACLVARMQETSRELEAVTERVPFDPHEFFDLDMVFHDHYLGLANTPRRSALYVAIRPQADRYRFFYSSSDHVGSLKSVAAEHEAIMEAIAAGSAEEAERAARNNWVGAAERVCRIMDVAGERGTMVSLEMREPVPSKR